MRIRQSYFLATIIALLFPLFLSAQIMVSKIDESFDPGSRDGIVYALPRTLIQVDVTVEKKELLAGPLRNYATKFLGITNYISNNGFEYSIKDVSLSSLSEPDPEQYYFVSLKDKTSKEAWQTILSLNGKGMITGLHDIGEETITDANGITAGMSQDEIMDIFRNYADLNMYARVDTIVRTINIDTITIEDYTFRTTMTEKPLEVKAEEAAGMIRKIREGRYNLLTGYQEVNYSEGALKFMNDELLRMEKEYLRLFTGAVVTSYLTYSFTYLPTAENIGNDVPLFRLSKTDGITLGGGGEEQVSIRIEASRNTASMASGSDASGWGLCYRIPEEATARVIFRGNTAAQLRTAISQFGKVSALPVNVSNVEFDGNTGGLRTIQLDAE